jgi:hypothetical protein
MIQLLFIELDYLSQLSGILGTITVVIALFYGILVLIKAIQLKYKDLYYFFFAIIFTILPLLVNHQSRYSLSSICIIRNPRSSHCLICMVTNLYPSSPSPIKIPFINYCSNIIWCILHLCDISIISRTRCSNYESNWNKGECY